MRLGAGSGRTRDDHLAVAAQLYAAIARARQLADLADVVGEAGLTPHDRRFLELETAFRSDFLDQGRDESRSLDETLDRAWRVLSILPRRELAMIGEDLLDAHYLARDEDPAATG
jgi:V/A-type H+-transporting ATPase subunit B